MYIFVYIYLGTIHLYTRPLLDDLWEQVAMKTNQMGVLYFTDNVPLGVMLEEGGIIDGQVCAAIIIGSMCPRAYVCIMFCLTTRFICI